jgi:4-aminobutyrate---pyruvate transaminase
MISRRASYHGSAIAGAVLGGRNKLHESFNIPTALSVLVSDPGWANAVLPGENEDAFTRRPAAWLEQANLEAGPGTIGAMIVKPAVSIPRQSRGLLSREPLKAADWGR